MQQKADLAENYLKAEIEALAFSLGPKNKPAVLRSLMRQLRTDAAGAEDGYLDLTRGVDRKPIPSVEGLRNVLVEACSKGPRAIAFARLRRQGNRHRRPPGSEQLLETRHQHVAILARHRNVADERIRCGLSRQLQRFGRG